MAIQKNGILGTFYNKVGAVIGRRYRRINMITGLHRSGTRKFSVGQLEQQVKLGLLNAMLYYFTEEITAGFKKYAKGKNPVNVAFSYNVNHAFIVLDNPELELAERISLNFPKLVLSRGDIYSPNCPALVIAAGGNFTCSWLDSPQSEFNRATDRVSLAVWNATQNTSWHFRNMAQRSALSFTASFEEGSENDELHGYLYCSSADGKQVGDSEYVCITK